MKTRDIPFAWFIVAGVLLVVVKLVLCSAQRVYLFPGEAVLDDTLMYNSAVSITEGDWLGAYGWKTLSKHSFFALWLAGLHTAGIPFLLGGQLLWALAALAGAWALAPVLRRRWLALLLFAVLWFSPASVANAQPYGFTLRVYRDNIFPALCLLCVAGMIGFALRYREPLKRSIGWPIVAGLGLAAAWLCREDGWWLLPFVVVAAVVALVYILRERRAALPKPRRALALLLPFVLLLAGILGWSGMNAAHYGRFIVSDFSSGEFADAYGAMTRIDHAEWNPKIAVPRDVRQQLYEHIPEFAPFEAILESPFYLSRYAVDDYHSGAFYWALREAAAELGHYDTPEAARQFFSQLAADINALCDDGTLAAGNSRSSVSPPIRAAYMGPVVAEGLYSLWFCATFQQCDARSMFSPFANDPGYYAEQIAPVEDFLHDQALAATVENSDAPYFTPMQTLFFSVFDGIRWVYTILTPLALAAALVWQVWVAVRRVGSWRRHGFVFRRAARRRVAVPRRAHPLRQAAAAHAAGHAGPGYTRHRPPPESLVWLVGLGLLGCIVLRAFMVAFVTVSSFDIGTYVMYLASIHPLMLLYAFMGTLGLWRLLTKKLGAPGRARAQKEAA